MIKSAPYYWVICDKCGEVCDVTEVPELEDSEAWGAREVRTVYYLVSNCCGDDVRRSDPGHAADHSRAHQLRWARPGDRVQHEKGGSRPGECGQQGEQSAEQQAMKASPGQSSPFAHCGCGA